MQYDIFISYSRSDQAIVDRFVQQLEAAGYNVWIDRTGVYSGTRFKSALVQAIEDSKVFLFFSSKDANASSWTAKEVAIAVDRQKTIIPIKLDSTHYNREVEFDLIGLDFVDYRNSSRRGQELEKLMRSLENTLGKKQPPRPQAIDQTSRSEKRGISQLSFFKKHRPWVITLTIISLLLVVGIPLFNSTTSDGFFAQVHATGQDDAETLFKLGERYYNGDGVTQDYKEAAKWYRMAAKQGYDSAQYYLGICYLNGNGVTQDYKEAVRWYRKAADQGLAMAQYKLGSCYLNGEGVAQDYEEAVKWYKIAAEQGCQIAIYSLGYMYKNGKCVTQDYKEAVKWYRMVAEIGDPTAEFIMGRFYYEGQGVTQDYEEAVKWYRKAAEKGESSAQCNLGYCYNHGYGVEQDYEEAVKWYRKAAEQESASAQYNLGRCYEHGEGVEQDYKEALKWYRMSAELGDEDAKRAVDRLTKYLEK